MAKMIQVSKAEHEMLVAAYAQDGLTIAKLEAELKQAKEDIKRLLVISQTRQTCEYCKKHFCPAGCEDCEIDAEWRGWKEDKQ